MRVAFRVDASTEIGTGHVARCLNLARGLQRRGARITFVCRAHPGNRIETIEAAGFAVHALPRPEVTYVATDGLPHAAWLGTSAERDAEETITALEGQSIDWLVVDHYALGARWEQRVGLVAGHILVIDDLADRPHACDLLVDQNVSSQSPDRYAKLAPGARHLIGPDFALLSEDYAVLHGLVPRRGGPIRRVIGFFGGSDTRQLCRRLVEAARESDFAFVDFDIVIGVHNPDRAAIDDLAASHPNIRIHREVGSLAGLFVRADLGIGAGGVTMLERCCLGLPSLVVTAAENQLPGALAAEALGVVRHLGWHADVSAATLVQSLRTALCDNFADMSDRCRDLVDGLGVQRVAAAMWPSSDIRYRRADASDEARLLIWANDPATREQAFSRGVISPADHKRWFAARLCSPDCRILIAEIDRLPVGQVRFDRHEGAWRISYSLDAAFRGQGLGKRMLSGAIDQFRHSGGYDGASFVAEVKATNPASLQVFRSQGYAEDIDGDVHRFRLALK